MMSKRLVVGLTGSFGSGKSTVGRILKQLGARRVIDSDWIAREALQPGHKVAKQVKSLFHIKGRLDRKQVAHEVFQHSEKRKRLEALIHPYVRQRIDQELKRVGRGIVVVEVPLLFETGFDQMCDVTVAVSALKRERMKRLSRKGFKPGEVRARLRAQLPDGEKKRRTDLWLENSGSRRLLVQRTKLLWKKLKSKYQEKKY